MSLRLRTRAWLLIALALLAGLFAATRLRIATDIRHFLPVGMDSGLSSISSKLATSPLTRTAIVALRAPAVLEHAEVFADCLDEASSIEWVRRGLDKDAEQATYDLYFPRRFYFAAPPDASLPDAAARLKRSLGGPRGPFIRPLAPKDPLLLYPDFLEGLRGSGSLRIAQGQFVTQDGSTAIFFVRTRGSAFDATAQREFQQQLMSCQRLSDASGDDTELLQSGIGRFALQAEKETKSDVTRVSLASTLAIVATFLLLFGRIRTIVLAFAPAAIGFAFGTAAAAIVAPEIHGISLAFGSALLGVGVDYAIHLMFHLDHARGRTVAEVVRRVRPGLLLGAATTCIGLAGLAMTTFPGMRELAVLGTVGIAGSLAATLVLIPAFVGTLPQRRIRTLWVEQCGRILQKTQRRKAPALIVLAVLVFVGSVGIASLEWSDGLRVLYQQDETLLAQDAEVRELTGAEPLSRMVLAQGSTLQQALERNDKVHEILAAATADGELEGFRSLHPWLPSQAAQQSNLQRLRSEAFAQQLDNALEEAGFVAGAFAPFYEALRSPPAPLVLEDLQGTPFEAIVSPFVIEADEEVVVVTWLRGELSAPLTARLSTVPGVQFFDQRRFLDEAYGQYRAEMVRMLAVGLVAVGLVVLLWYRSVRIAIAAFLPALAGACGALAATAWIDGSANLVHAAALLLVCSIGADYGVFMVEAGDDAQDRAITWASAGASALTTMLSFGLLAMSDNVALASVGRAVVVGVGCALLSSPVSTLLSARKPSSAPERTP
ncbi:MAG: MMPL family transporter [Nannocystaceae bacterium]|nr:MMPL family transporter [Nannocystaceae bacterium]